MVTRVEHADYGCSRREFIGAAAAGTMMPAVMSLIPAGPVVAGPQWPGDLHVDDQWSGFPRYADPIGFGRRRTAAPMPAVHPADEQFIAF